MEHVLKVVVVFAINIIMALLAIVIANGDLTWATIGLVLFLALILGTLVGTWIVVHGKFERSTEIALTIVIFIAFVAAFTVAVTAGSAIKATFVELFSNGTAWWILSPLFGAVVTLLLFGVTAKKKK